MEWFLYRTRELSKPGQIPNVYLCCHQRDRQLYLDAVTEELLRLYDCTVWYAREAEAPRDEEFLEELGRMQLMVVPVTEDFLTEPNPALTEFRHALKRHIPVLPLLQGLNLEGKFNQVCGQLQCLDKFSTDPTALPYEQKLRNYLFSVLVDESLAKKIRDAFDAYVFLSYRKKDRKHARRLMELVHADESCRDVAVWYDEYLIPGEDFNENIGRMLRQSQLFLMAVTPNIICEPNYVRDIEYPMALQSGKPILPVEMEPTDRQQLLREFEGLTVFLSVEKPEELVERLRCWIRELVLEERNSTPEHLYYIGMAYLAGIDVEVDRDRAVELLTRSAEAGCIPALEKLVDVYTTGHLASEFDREGSDWLNRRMDAVEGKELTREQAMAFLEFCESRDLTSPVYGAWDLVRLARLRAEVCRSLEETHPQRYLDALVNCGDIMAALIGGELHRYVLNGHDEYPWTYYDLGAQSYARAEELLKTMPESSEKTAAQLKLLLGKCRLEIAMAPQVRGSTAQRAKTLAQALIDNAQADPRFAVYGWLEMDRVAKLEKQLAAREGSPIISQPLDLDTVLEAFGASILKPAFRQWQGDVSALENALLAARKLDAGSLPDCALRLKLLLTCARHFEWEKNYPRSIGFWCEAVEIARKIMFQTRQDGDIFRLALACGGAARVYDQMENTFRVESYLTECFSLMRDLYDRHGWKIRDYGNVYKESADYLAAYWKHMGDASRSQYYRDLSNACYEQSVTDLDDILKKLKETMKTLGL